MNKKIKDTLIISGKTYKIKFDDKLTGGWFRNLDQTIVLGTKPPITKEGIWEVLLHEVCETILAEREMRYHLYSKPGNGDYLFSFDHKEFQQFVKDLYLALKPLLKGIR